MEKCTRQGIWDKKLQINRLSKSARGDFGSASVETKSLFEAVQNVLYQIRRATQKAVHYLAQSAV